MKQKNKRKNKKPEQFRLNKYYYAIEFSAFFILAVCGVTIYAFLDQITWLRYPRLLLYFIAGMLAYNLFFFACYQLTRRTVCFTFTRYAFIVFFVAALYTLNSIDTAFVIMLIFPLIVSAVNLDAKETGRIGVAVTVLYGLLIFADPVYLKDISLVSGHFLRVIILAFISFYMYKLVKETLRNKYEKEEAKKKFLELIELERIKTDFLTVAQHQLRTPLTAVKWGLYTILQNMPQKPAEKSSLEQIQSRAEEALGIVDEMLKTADYGLEQFHLDIRSVDLSAILGRALTELQFLARKNNVQIKFKPLECLIDGDGKLLQVAFFNIIDNAIRYGANGAVDIKIRRDGSKAIVKVKDNGIGIDEESQPYIFERFYRSKKAMTISPNESGVGLYITKKIINLHGGEVTLKSQAGRGAEAEIVLPVKRK